MTPCLNKLVEKGILQSLMGFLFHFQDFLVAVILIMMLY